MITFPNLPSLLQHIMRVLPTGLDG